MKSQATGPSHRQLESTLKNASTWQTITDLVNESGFLPGEMAADRESQSLPGRGPLPPLTLFEAVRIGLGVPSDCVDYADVSFWNWKELRSAWTEVWAVLDELASSTSGSPIKAVAWAYPRARASSEVVELLHIAESSAPHLRAPLPAPRPHGSNMVNKGQISAAIANTLGVIRVAVGDPYCDFLPSLISEDATDEEFLQRLDEFVSRESLDQTKGDRSTFIPRALVRARFSVGDEEGNSTRSFVGFLRQLDESNNLAGNSDQAFLHRLTTIAPEKSKEIKAKIEELLSS